MHSNNFGKGQAWLYSFWQETTAVGVIGMKHYFYESKIESQNMGECIFMFTVIFLLNVLKIFITVIHSKGIYLSNIMYLLNHNSNVWNLINVKLHK